MRANEMVIEQTKKPYVKPQLVTYGSVQQLTEGGFKPKLHEHDCGSSLKVPSEPSWGFKGW